MSVTRERRLAAWAKTAIWVQQFTINKNEASGRHRECHLNFITDWRFGEVIFHNIFSPLLKCWSSRNRKATQSLVDTHVGWTKML